MFVMQRDTIRAPEIGLMFSQPDGKFCWRHIQNNTLYFLTIQYIFLK